MPFDELDAILGAGTPAGAGARRLRCGVRGLAADRQVRWADEGKRMYFEDLTPYQYDGGASDQNIVNVGWLSREHAHQTGDVPLEFVEALRILVASPVNLYRGSHLCEYCPQPEVFVRNGLRMMEPSPEITGNGEIRVVDTSGRTFVAPVLIRHYVEVHHYRPPAAFIAAVLSRP